MNFQETYLIAIKNSKDCYNQIAIILAKIVTDLLNKIVYHAAQKLADIMIQ